MHLSAHCLLHRLGAILDYLGDHFSDLPWPRTAQEGTLLVACLGLLSLIGLFRQLGETQRRFRAEVAPYLRVDLSLDVPGGTWVAPDDGTEMSKLTFEDLNEGESLGRSALDDWAGLTPIYLWARNLQERPGGIADDVLLLVELEYPDKVTGDPWIDRLAVRFSYLEAGHLNRYEVARVDTQVPWLTGRILQVRYATMFGRLSTWAHGSAEFEWRNGKIVNIRRGFRERGRGKTEALT